MNIFFHVLINTHKNALLNSFKLLFVLDCNALYIYNINDNLKFVNRLQKHINTTIEMCERFWRIIWFAYKCFMDGAFLLNYKNKVIYLFDCATILIFFAIIEAQSQIVISKSNLILKEKLVNLLIIFLKLFLSSIFHSYLFPKYFNLSMATSFRKITFYQSQTSWLYNLTRLFIIT